jgi:hypothetical protein
VRGRQAEGTTLAWTVTLLVCAGFIAVSEYNVGRSYGWDEGVYLASARLVAKGHPLFSDVFSSQPPVFLETLAAAFRIFGDRGEVATRVVILFGALALGATAWIGARLAGPWGALVAVLAMLSKDFFDQGITVEAEMPALALGLVAVALLCPPHEDRPGRPVAAGAIFGLAALTKLWIVPYASACGLLLIVDPRDDGSGAWRFRTGFGAALWRLVLFGASAATVGALVVSRYDVRDLYAQVVGFHLAAAEGGGRAFARGGQEVLERFGAHNASIGSLAAAGFVVLLLRNRLAALLLVSWGLASVALVLWNAPAFARHALLVGPPAALLAAAVVVPALAGGPGRRGVAVALLALLLMLRPSVGGGRVVWTVPLATQLPAQYTPDPQQGEAVELIRDLTRPDDVVAADAPLLPFLANRDVPPPLVDVSGTRILSGEITAGKAAAWSSQARLVVFWGDRFDRLPGYRDWVQSRYRRVARWPTSAGRRELYLRD